MSAALLLAAVALVVWPVPGAALARVVERPRSSRFDVLFHGEPRWIGRNRAGPDPFAVAATYDLMAVCLRAGLPVGVSAAVGAERAPQPLAGSLARAADLLALGADPVQAWSFDSAPSGRTAKLDENFRELSMLARRAARAGSSLADAIAGLAESTREDAQTQALARAEKAGVTISGPLGLCFLPAFVCLGIVPVVVGLADGMLGRW